MSLIDRFLIFDRDNTANETLYNDERPVLPENEQERMNILLYTARKAIKSER